MLMVDLRNTNARLTMREFLASGRRYASNPIAFASFASGLRFGPRILLDERWRLPGNASSRFAFFRVLMHEILPPNYDVRHLETLGGRFALSLKPVGDYTVIALNRRVVTLSGLPRDEKTGAAIADVTMRPDAFLALCNELIADLSEKTLKALGKSG
ncbi:hypothetical protein T281_08405 [Rhodomicrobium udaipurense JA643]|uniref:Uncharacterized protein n=1 Tax=Rhodomicrobium udaipurense TaxID=1202716 RepID=A0A8I1GB72_9HYPH|nr:hypothetical protein [Rhodomicrobium udaipurense]KAI94898.1 hypothetical protein T281_08405 [Rhodomicrobium udaipurense JA643]MBJ7543873.1 hypothetical protein [Rhodomicrobium udaipurense]